MTLSCNLWFSSNNSEFLSFSSATSCSTASFSSLSYLLTASSISIFYLYYLMASFITFIFFYFRLRNQMNQLVAHGLRSFSCFSWLLFYQHFLLDWRLGDFQGAWLVLKFRWFKTGWVDCNFDRATIRHL